MHKEMEQEFQIETELQKLFAVYSQPLNIA